MSAIVSTKWALLSEGIACIVVGKLHVVKQGKPVILVVIQKTMKILFHNLVDLFCLPLALQMIGRRGEGHNAKKSKKLPSKTGDELRALIRRDTGW